MDNRRDFLKNLGLAGAAAITTGNVRGMEIASDNEKLLLPRKEHFNMCGYVAPKLETVRVGLIGLGNRGPGHLEKLIKIEGVEIKALCDLRPERINEGKKALINTNHNPDIYTGNVNEWKKLCERKDIDIVYIATPWKLHTAMAVYAMEQGKHAATEVPAAVTVEECWKLVETSERTRKHCVILENCCYDFFELLTLNMARNGFFGEIIHCEGAYIHDLLEANFEKGNYFDMWRLKENLRNGCLYPTHGLGPIAQILNINRGDKMEYLISMSSNDFMMAQKANEMAVKDDFYAPYANKKFRGNLNTTNIRTNNGKTIMMQHDVSSPRPYSRIHLVSGTKGTALKYPLPGRVSQTHEHWFNDAEMKELETKYQPPIVKKIGEQAKEIGGHGGMDFLLNWRLIDCLRNGLPLDLDVYDAAAWSAIGPLSEKSVARRSEAIAIPDFTSGSWKINQPVDISLQHGGTTRVVQ